MRAIQVSMTGGPEVLELVELAVPVPAAGQVLVKIEAAGVNFIATDQYEDLASYMKQNSRDLRPPATALWHP